MSLYIVIIYIVSQIHLEQIMADQQQKKKQHQNYGKYLKAKEFVQTMFTTVIDKDLSYIKLYFNNLYKQFKQSTNQILQQYQSPTHLINNLKQAKGKYLLHFACARGNLPIVRYLIEQHKADYYVKDEQENIPMFVAIQHQHVQLVKYFVEELKVRIGYTRNDVTALHLAVMNGYLQLTQYLISKGADLQKISNYGKPINWAVAYNRQQIVQLLLKHGANPNGDHSSNFPGSLLMSLAHNNPKIIELLLEHGADPHIIDSNGQSTLSLAAQKCGIEIVKKLVERKVDVNYVCEGKTALDIAYMHKNWPVVQYLRPLTSKGINSQNLKPSPIISPLYEQQDLQKAILLKQQGNQLFNKKSYQQALLKYHLAIRFDQNNQILYSNKSLCLYKLQKYKEALEAAQKCKQIDPKYVKGVFREAEAYLKLQEYCQAAASYWQALQLDPSNKQIKSLFQTSVKKGKLKHN